MAAAVAMSVISETVRIGTLSALECAGPQGIEMLNSDTLEYLETLVQRTFREVFYGKAPFPRDVAKLDHSLHIMKLASGKFSAGHYVRNLVEYPAYLRQYLKHCKSLDPQDIRSMVSRCIEKSLRNPSKEYFPLVHESLLRVLKYEMEHPIVKTEHGTAETEHPIADKTLYIRIRREETGLNLTLYKTAKEAHFSDPYLDAWIRGEIIPYAEPSLTGRELTYRQAWHLFVWGRSRRVEILDYWRSYADSATQDAARDYFRIPKNKDPVSILESVLPKHSRE